MNLYKTNDYTLIQTAQKVVLDVLKDDPTLRQEDGSYVYEVTPIPGDRLNHAEIQQINKSVNPSGELLSLVGWKYYDVISATEQALYQYCVGKIQLEIPDATQADIMDILTQSVHADPPIQFYMKQLCSDRVQR